MRTIEYYKETGLPDSALVCADCLEIMINKIEVV